MSHRRTLIEGLELAHGESKIHRLNIRGVKKRNANHESRKTLSSTNKMREQFGVTVPNAIKESLLIDKITGNSKWQDATKKEMMSLEKSNDWKFHSPGHRAGIEFQRTQLSVIFDVKKEDGMHKARHVVGVHVIDSSHVE